MKVFTTCYYLKEERLGVLDLNVPWKSRGEKGNEEVFIYFLSNLQDILYISLYFKNSYLAQMINSVKYEV